MAYEFNGVSSQAINGAGPVLTNFPLTMALWMSCGNQDRRNIGIIDATADNRLAAISPYNQYMRLYTIGNTNSSLATNTTFVSGAYSQVTGRSNSRSSRAVALNGVAPYAEDNTTDVTVVGVDRIAIGGYGSFYAGLNAEVAIWNVAITDAEITSLAKGFSPRRIRPQSLVFYAPLLRNLQDLRQGLALTAVNAPTVANHPRVY